VERARLSGDASNGMVDMAGKLDENVSRFHV